jgi:hypothetical protein
MNKSEKADNLINLIKGELSYYCEYCGRHLPVDDGVVIHDETYHPENYIPDDGSEHKLQ